MQNLKFSFCILIGLTVGYPIHSQSIDKSILHSFTPSIAKTIYEITRFVPLNKEQQFLLATRYQQQDSIIVRWLSEDKGQKSIDSLQKMSDGFLYSLLTPQQTINYIHNKAVEFSSQAVIGELEHIRQEYHPDVSLRASTPCRII